MVSQDKYGEAADDYIFFYGNGNDNNHLGTDLFIHMRIRLAVKRVESVNASMLHIILRDHVIYCFECACSENETDS
jgi:predicted molibdopterin-dependent oxidoreductase YjgC